MQTYQTLESWQQAVDACVREYVQDDECPATGLAQYGNPEVAQAHELKPHPMGPNALAWYNNVQPSEYAMHIANELILSGWEY